MLKEEKERKGSSKTVPETEDQTLDKSKLNTNEFTTRHITQLSEEIARRQRSELFLVRLSTQRLRLTSSTSFGKFC